MTRSILGNFSPLRVDTVAEMTALGVKVGDIVETKEFTDGNGGGGTYDAVLTSSVTPNTFNIIIGVKDTSISFVLRLQDEFFVQQIGGAPAVSDIGIYINHSFTIVKNGIINVGGGNFTQTTTINIPNNTSLKGAGRGFASNFRTRVNYTGTGTAITYSGFYTILDGFHFRYQGGSKGTSVGVDYGTVTRTTLNDVTLESFGKGLKTNGVTPTFTHLHTNVYIKDCITAGEFLTVNNIVFDKCFIESNGTGFILDKVFNFVIYGGSALEIFGDLRDEETIGSKLFKVTNSGGICIRDCYGEMGTLAAVSNNIQLGEFANVRGLTVENVYFNRSASNQAPWIEFLDDNCSAVSVKNNFALKGNSTGTDFLALGKTSIDVLELSGISGTFVIGEVITGGTSGATGTVVSFTKNDLFLGTVTGTYVAAEIVTGGTSGAVGTVDVVADLSKVAFRYDIVNNAIKSTMLEKPIEYVPILEQAGAPMTGVTYDIQEATCVLAGNVCTISFQVSLSAISSPPAGGLSISMPVKSFPSLGVNNECMGFLGAENLTSVFVGYAIRLESGGITLPLQRDFSTAISGNNLTATSTFRGNITFPIDRQTI